jgi:flagellar M-ring protein FliF
MAFLVSLWESMSAVRRVSLVAGLMLVLSFTILFGWWALRTPYSVLFADLKEADVAVVVGELEKLKVPYRLSGGGQTVLVPESDMYKTRMTLMGRQLPLGGTVGFELFNNAEFGVSDFVQKVNYQRALQGELTRTIQSIEQLRSVRVHLAIPEAGIFRKDAQRAKASVTVSLRPGQALAPAQVLGIQRLVGASVPEVQAEDVTVLDQHGNTLSRPSGEGGSSLIGADLADSRGSLEATLGAKARAVLDGLFGAGNALVTVDVVLNHLQVRTTTEEVLPAQGLARDDAPRGVMVRERGSTLESTTSDPASPATRSSHEVEYQSGKRVEHIVSPSGAVSRLSVAVVLRQPLAPEELEKVKALVATAVGLQPSRGDAIAVYSVPRAGSEPTDPVTLEPTQAQAKHGATAWLPSSISPTVFTAAAAILMLGWAALFFVIWRSRRARVATAPALLTEDQRQAALLSVQRWVSQAKEEPRA